MTNYDKNEVDHCKIIHNEEVCDLHKSSSIARTVKSKKLQCVRRVPRICETGETRSENCFDVETSLQASTCKTENGR